MAKPLVLYYIHTYFLDSCLETLQSIKYHVDIDLIIEVSRDSLKSTVFELDDISSYRRLEDVKDVFSPDVWNQFSTYFEHLRSVRVLFFKGRSMFGFDNMMGGLLLGRLIHANRYSVIHFDTASARAIMSLFFMFKKRLVMTIHDPVVHTGESSFVLNFVRNVYKRFSNALFFYSAYSLDVFTQSNHTATPNVSMLMLQPYSFIAQFKGNKLPFRNHILFFGQLSYYKGIDLLLQAIPIVLKQYPDEHFIIAGKSSGYKMDNKLITQYPNNIHFIHEYLCIEELSNLINNAKFVVCPYREATQSGVLMTAFAMGRSVLATNVGAFPEYINNGVNGLLSDTDYYSIAQGILEMLESDHYMMLEKQVSTAHSTNASEHNKNTLLEVYSLPQSSTVMAC